MPLLLAFLLLASPSQAAVKNPDTLVILTGLSAETLDPASAYGGTDLFVNYNVYETLIANDGGDLSRFIPLLAARVPEAEADGRTYRFPLRPGVRFHEGGTLTAEDARYSLLRFMLADRPGGPSGLLREAVLGPDADFNDAFSAVRVEDGAVVVELAQPFPAFLSVIARWGAILNKRWAVSNGDWDGTAADLPRLRASTPEEFPLHRRANGTGPFRLERWDAGNSMLTLRRFDGYWGTAAKLAAVRIIKNEDFSAKKLMLFNGDADSIYVDHDQISQVRGVAGVRVTEGLPILHVEALVFNQRLNAAESRFIGSGALDGDGVPPDFFASVEMRRAFAALIDYDGLIRDLYRGNAERATGFIPRGMAGYESAPAPYAFDPAAAERLLRAAYGGRLWEKGFKMTLAYPAWAGAKGAIARQLAAALRGVNPRFLLEVRALPSAGYYALQKKGALPLALGGWRADYADPHNMAQPLLRSGGYFASLFGFGDAETDALIDRARTEADPALRRALYSRIRDRWALTLPMAFTFTEQWMRVERDWVRGFAHNPIYPGAPAYSPLAPIYKEE